MVWARFRDPSDLPIKVTLLIGYRMAVAQRMPSPRNPLRLSDFCEDDDSSGVGLEEHAAEGTAGGPE